MITTEFEKVCIDHFDRFFAAYPNVALQRSALTALGALVGKGTPLAGKLEGWAAGVVYAVGSRGVGVPGVLNREFEAAFGVKMSDVYKFAAKVKDILGPDLPFWDANVPEVFTLRDEANAMCAYAFRNGFIEDIHADGRISDEEMKRLMIQASENLAKLLARKQDSPTEYDQFIRDYNRKYCWRWNR